MIELKKKKKLPKRIRNVDICAGSRLFLDIILVLYMALYIMVYILVSRKGYYVSFSCLHYEQQEAERILKGKTIRRDRTKVFIQNIHHFYFEEAKRVHQFHFFFKRIPIP